MPVKDKPTLAYAPSCLLAFNTALGALWAGHVTDFDAFLFVVFSLMAAGALPLLVRYLRSMRQAGGRKAGLC